MVDTDELKTFQIKHPYRWTFGIAYAVLAPAAFLIPVNIFEIAPWTRGFTDTVAWAIPMINRVVSYGNPHPDKLRFFLAIAWLLTPVFFLFLWPNGLQATKKNRKQRSAIDTAVTTIPMLALLFFVIWYWPSFDFFGPAFPISLYSQFDERKRMFFDALRLSIWTPLWLLGATGVLGQIAAEVVLLIYPSKVNA